MALSLGQLQGRFPQLAGQVLFTEVIPEEKIVTIWVMNNDIRKYLKIRSNRKKITYFLQYEPVDSYINVQFDLY